MWFKKLTGFEEISPENVRNNLYIEGQNMISKANGSTYQFGSLEIPSLADLRTQVPDLAKFKGQIQVSEVVGDVQELHYLPENQHALFQAASQFNLLEMVGPNITPEKGVDIYDRDYTQGPACAIACGAGTIYRNYFLPVNGKIGQTEDNQVDCLELIGKALNNEELLLWQMRNGYALATQEGLKQINQQLSQLNEAERETLKGQLKIGIQWDTQVTIIERKQLVSQAYCSALPVAYSFLDESLWEDFARLVLEATYEATLYAALINFEKTNSNQVFLTLVGGGAFGNDFAWIKESIFKAIQKFQNTPIDVKIVSYRAPHPMVIELLEELSSNH